MEKNIFERITNLLKSKEKYVSDEGELLKAKVYSDIMTMDQKLLALLLSDEEIKKAFFVKIDDTLVFDKQKFAWIIDSKEFLPDSYTSYTNKIGLTSNGDFISQKKDVVLDFPYKDCVLEGGQDKDDQKRKEIFYNETLASNEIRRMLEPKVFTNAKRYTKDGVEENITFNEDDNLIIKGNNLIALTSLLKRYEGQVKCIYIDPPYNPDSVANTFSYNNSFNHSTWLTFMKNRASQSKKLLSENGVFCCAIDHNELFYLGVLFDEVFGRENRIGIVSVETNPGGRSDSTFFASSSEYFIVYAKNIDKAVIYDITKDKEKLNVYNKEDSISKYKLVPLRRTGSNSTPDKRPNLCYPIYYNNKTRQISVDDYSEEENWVEIMPMGSDKMRVWRWSKNKLMNSLDDIEIVCKDNEFDVYVKDRIKNTEKAKTMWYGSKYDASANGTKILQKLNLSEDFSYPKSVYLIKDILELLTKENDLVLDFHLGSGTTAAVAHKMGRRYIGVEQMDYIEDITVERLKKVIDGEQGGISKAVDWQGGGSFVYCELMENGNEVIREIENADENTIKNLKEKIYKDERIVPYIITEELEKVDTDFDELNLEDKKKALIKVVDKNKLYVNYSDIDNADYDISEADKKFTKSFYEVD